MSSIDPYPRQRTISRRRLALLLALALGASVVAFSPQLVSGRGSRLRWEEIEEQPHADMLDWYKRLIRLRREIPDLTDGRLDLVSTRVDEERRTLVVRRGPITVACNFGPEASDVELDLAHTASVLLTSGKDPQILEGTITLIRRA